MNLADRRLVNATIAGALVLWFVFPPLLSGTGLVGVSAAFAKDGGSGSSGGSGSGSSGGSGSDGGSGSGSDGGSGSGSSGGSGSGGSGSGSDGGSSGSGNDHSGSGHDPADSGGGKPGGNDRSKGGRFEVIYADGFKEEIRHGVLELKDPSGRTVIRRQATSADYARLRARNR